MFVNNNLASLESNELTLQTQIPKIREIKTLIILYDNKFS